MWVDASVNSSKENLQAQKTLIKIHNEFKTFESVDECENAIQQLSKTSRAIIVISGGFGRELLPRIHDLPQVLTIYIFCMDQAKHLEWAKQFNKIKAIIVDLHKLISTIQFDHELRINVTKPIQINIPDPNSKSENKILDTFQYSSKYLVIAGELQYTEKTMRDIATEIVNRFKSDPNRDFNVLISETVQPIMYLLKREQNLVDFSNPFKRLLSKEKDIPCVSQRFLIDTIMMNSDRFLCRRLTSLLSKRNSVPMIQPPLDSTNNEYRSISNIIHVWDYHRPVLLSFGIGQCKGKTSLMNTLFDSNFEQSMKDRYFSATIDVDFGYHFVERRPINIADTHGEISSEILAQISMLFNGFLIHVNSAYLCSNQSNVIKYLQLLSPESYVLLLIRDVDDENDEKIQSTVETICSVCSHCQSHYLPNVVDKTTDENREKIDEVREKIFRDTVQLQCLDEKSIQEYLKRLLNNTQKEIIEQDIAFINSIRSILIDGKEENYLLYTLFTKLCKKRLEVAKIDPYDKDFQDEKLYKLNLELFNADSEFKEKQRMGSHAYGAGFELFFNLLQKQESRLTKLHLLSMELRKEADKKKTGQKDLPFYNQLSLEIHWRNAIIGSTSLSNAELEILVNTYRDYIAEGNPFEIVDGDNFEMQGNFLTKVFELFPNKKFFVISINGPQNSGKSTLLNFLFGTLFEARDGRCTKGIYGTLINVQSKTNKNQLIPLDYDYILVIDTEGLLSIQKHDEQYDKRLILFCLAVSHLVIVNVEIEINEAVRKFFVLCTQALKYLGETRVTQPTVHFILNKRPNPDEEYCKTLLECVRTTLKDNKLDNEINLQPDNFHVLSTAFNRNPFKILNGKCAAFSTDITFVTNVQKLCKFLIDTSSDIIRQTGDGFCIPTSWIAFANRILRTIKKHPDLTHFQDVFERDQYNKIRDDIRRDFDQYLSPTVARYLMDKEKQNSTDNIKDSFKIEYERILKTLEDRLREHCGQCQASENIQERSSQFMQVQLISIFRSWEVSARMASRRYKIDQIVNDIENKLRTKAISVTHKNYLMDKQSATEMFDEELKDIFVQIKDKFKSEMVWKQSIDMVSHLCDVLDKDVLPTGNNILVYLPFLKTLDDGSLDQSISMDDCLSKIRAKFISESSNLDPLTSHLINMSSLISRNEIKQPHKFLNNDELSRIYFVIYPDGKETRESVRKGARQLYSQLFNDNWMTIVQISKCFEVLLADIKEILTSTNNDEPWTEITLVQKILGTVNKVIQDFNNELNIFNFCLSKQFRSTLYICTVISTALYYYNRQKTHFLHVIRCASENKSKLIKRFLPWVVLIENDDENVATNRINELSQVLCQLFQPQIKEIIEKHVNNEMTKTLNRCSIIKELDDEVYHATDDWLKRYVLYPIKLIIKRFNEKWTKVKAEVDEKLNMIVNLVSMRLRDIFELIKTVNTISQELGAHSLSFVDSLFKLKDEQRTDHANDKQFCMSKLFYLYLVGEDIPSEISTRNGSIYTVDSKWRTIIDHFPKPSAKIKQVFCLLQNAFEMSTISYLGFFLDKILSRQNETELIVSNQLTSFIRNTYLIIEEQLSNRMRGCQARCPCCKRICDVDHHLNITSPIGQEENRHCCKFGHQIRGMGGIRYEITDEASTSWCEIIKDNDPITIDNNIRQTWKNFKSANADWDFGDGLRVREKLETSYAYIWEKIGKQLCDHFGNGMKFVKQNTPSPVNHFIFVLDHSGSMNERSNILTRLITLTATANNSNETNISPWEHLRRAVKGFIDIRIKQVSLNDEITMILFASRSERIYNRERVTDIDFNRINTPMNICGSGTNFSAAFQMVIKTLEEVNNDSERNKMQQTIIFMTDGEPQGYPTTELQQLRDYKTDTTTNQNNKALINNFWTMALGNFNKKVIEKINQTIQGKLVNIEQAEDLVEAYAQIAEIL
ncbi:unnamed protein product [Rotaria sordida]|uniref:VWFA domain-containing protein n=1 Tax=Rotaria sordida TaxID=392033 RepID=A0A814WRS5_9BILA|nr:unnamed protein product [Rotaria sordida]